MKKQEVTNSTPNKRRSWQRSKIGDIFEINIKNEYFCYAQLVTKRYVIIFNYKTIEPLKEFEILNECNILFCICTYTQVISQYDWIKVGHLPMRKEYKILPMQCIYNDAVEHSRFSLYNPNTGEIIPANMEQIRGLEALAVYDTPHVEKRIDDYFNNRPSNDWDERTLFSNEFYGNIYEIKVYDEYYCYVQMLTDQQIIVFDYRSKAPLTDLTILRDCKILFCVCALVRTMRWKEVGKLPVSDKYKVVPMKYIYVKNQTISFYLYNPNTGNKTPANKNDIKGLEAAQVYNRKMLEERVDEYYNNKPLSCLTAVEHRELFGEEFIPKEI